MRALPITMALVAVVAAACQKTDTDRAPDGAGVSASDSQGVEDMVRVLEQEWADAIRIRDSVSLERLVAQDFTVTSEATTDPPVARATWMTNTLHNLRVDSIRISPAGVVVNGDTASATLDFFWVGQFMSTPPFRDSTVLTDIWVRKAGAWQVHRRVLAK